MTTIPELTRVSQATREFASCRSRSSRTASEIWSATLSGWPSETDSEVKMNSRDMGLPRQHGNENDSGEKQTRNHTRNARSDALRPPPPRRVGAARREIDGTKPAARSS